jgi:hypothetical protein
MAHREKIAALWKCILFSYLEFEYSRSTTPGVYLTVFMQRAQPHLQNLGSHEICTMDGDDEAVYCFYENSN